MEIWHHIVFTKSKHAGFCAYITERGLVKPGSESKGTVQMDISERNPYWIDVQKYILENHVFSLSETSFTEKELSDASFLRVWSRWRCGYPQPEDGFAYRSITYSEHNFCKVCGRGLFQQAPFWIKKTPNWGNRHFMMLNWVMDELFMDDTAKSVLLDAGIAGGGFRQVLNKKGTEVLPNIWQWDISKVLSAGVCFDNRSLDRITMCSACGGIKYHPTGVGMLPVRREVFTNAPDVMKTEEFFGSDHAAGRKIIVSQRIYRLLKDNRLIRGLVFEPIELVCI